MKGIRVIKRGAIAGTNNATASQSDRDDREREREAASMVKSWVAEWEERNRLVKAAAFSLLHSLKGNTESPTQPFAVVKG